MKCLLPRRGLRQKRPKRQKEVPSVAYVAYVAPKRVQDVTTSKSTVTELPPEVMDAVADDLAEAIVAVMLAGQTLSAHEASGQATRADGSLQLLPQVSVEDGQQDESRLRIEPARRRTSLTTPALTLSRKPGKGHPG